MRDERHFITFPTWKKYIVLSRTIENLRVRDKRHIFYVMRNMTSLSHNTFFPAYGFTAGEFAMWQVLSDTRRPRKQRDEPVAAV